MEIPSPAALQVGENTGSGLAPGQGPDEASDTPDTVMLRDETLQLSVRPDANYCVSYELS